MFNPFTSVRCREKSYNGEENPSQEMADHFGPATAVVVEAIVGQSDELGVIKCYGGSLARALSYEPFVLPVGLRVKVLRRIPSMNIWVVASFEPPLSQLTAVPSSDWVASHLKKHSHAQEFAS